MKLNVNRPLKRFNGLRYPFWPELGSIHGLIHGLLAPFASMALMTLLSGGIVGNLLVEKAQANDLCPASALAQIVSHRVSAGETLASIAATYDLLPATLINLNPGIGQTVSPGQQIRIPPFNGQVVRGGAGTTWQSLAERYGRQADLLFEINGCSASVPNQVFIPGFQSRVVVQEGPLASQARLLTGYPLAETVPVLQSYGWQPHPVRDEIVFNSGIAFDVATPTVALAVGEGTIAFTGNQEGYGNLVVVNHPQGLQTRYGNLGEISVSIGQRVRLGDALGTVGSNQAASFLYFEVRTNSDQGWVAQNPGEYLSVLELR